MKLYMAAILAISFLDIFNEGIVRGSFGSQTLPLNQCIDLHTNQIDIKNLSGYEEQEVPFKAVIFITKKGIRICVPHDVQWVRNNIRKLNKRTKSKPRPSTRRAFSTPRSMGKAT